MTLIENNSIITVADGGLFMNLLFDIDDTITNETDFMIKYAPIYLKKKYGLNVQITNPHGYNVVEVFGLKEKLKDNAKFYLNLEAKLDEINKSFWNKYFIRYLFYPIKKDASKIISDLRKQGYKINFASLRGRKTKENEKLKDKFIRTKIVPFLTKMQLKLNHIKYDKVFLVEKNEDKINIANELNAKIVFDDSVEVLENVENSIAVCVQTPHNINVNFKNKNVVKLPFSFEEIKHFITDYEEKKILLAPSKRKISKLKIYKKALTEKTYKLLRVCSKHKIIKAFKPLVIGEDNLPKLKGPNMFVGNHRNIKDPLIVISLLKNPTHFAALKRMFEYKDNLFGKVGKNVGTIATTLFVKSMGALPIARPTDENYRKVNLKTFRDIMDYLATDSSVTIYPEGTLNRNPKEDGNILPLKSDQTFRVAENGRAIIRPVAIVWVPEDVKIENRVLIAFLKPIYTHGLKTEQILERWYNSVNGAIDSMNQIISELDKIGKSNYPSSNSEKIRKLSNDIKRL